MKDLNDSEVLALDVSNIKTAEDFHQYLKLKLEFPEFYGMNWDAFWDAITGLVELPENIVIIGWNELVKLIPEETNSFIEIMELYNKEYPMWKCSIRYI